MSDIRIKKIKTTEEKQRVVDWIKQNENYMDYNISDETEIYAILLLDKDSVEIMGVFELSNIPFLRVALNKDKTKFHSYKSFEMIRAALDTKDIHPVMLLDKDNPMYECVDKKLIRSDATMFTF